MVQYDVSVQLDETEIINDELIDYLDQRPERYYVPEAYVYQPSIRPLHISVWSIDYEIEPLSPLRDRPRSWTWATARIDVYESENEPEFPALDRPEPGCPFMPARVTAGGPNRLFAWIHLMALLHSMGYRTPPRYPSRGEKLRRLLVRPKLETHLEWILRSI